MIVVSEGSVAQLVVGKVRYLVGLCPDISCELI